MSSLFLTRTAAAAVLASCLGAAGAAALTAEAHRTAKDAVATSYKAEQDSCKQTSGNARDICSEQAKSRRGVALAEIEYRQSGKPVDAVKVAMARADGAFAVAKEKCDDLKGQPKSLCRTEAATAHQKSKADAKLATTVSEARSDAVEDKTAAERKLAEAKCDAMAGSAKTQCASDLKARSTKP
jgi:hypothetical protein